MNVYVFEWKKIKLSFSAQAWHHTKIALYEGTQLSSSFCVTKLKINVLFVIKSSWWYSFSFHSVSPKYFLFIHSIVIHIWGFFPTTHQRQEQQKKGYHYYCCVRSSTSLFFLPLPLILLRCFFFSASRI